MVMERRDVIEELLSHVECFRFIDLGDSKGRAALHEAAARGNKQIVWMLLNSGANIDVPDEKGMTPLHLIIWLRQTNRPDEERSMLFSMAEEMVKLCAAEVNTRDRFGEGPN